MSGTLAPTNQQSPIQFSGIERTTEKQPIQFTRNVAKRQYVAGGYFHTDINTILRKSSDSLTRKFGDEIIDKMLQDAEIKKCETVLKIMVLGEGVTVAPALSKPAPVKALPEGTEESIEQKRERLTREKDLQRYELAVKYADFVTRAIENLDGFRSTLENMLDAIAYGNKVAEQTYKEVYDKEFGRNMLTLDSVRVKSRKSINFVLNKYKKLVGFQSPYTNGGKTGEDTEKILPREKFLVLTFRGKDCDPRGTPILEAAYTAWHLKMQLWPEYLRWLLQCALPSLVGTTSETSDQKKYIVNSETGEPIRDALGNPIYEAQTDDLLQALLQLRSASAIAIPHGAEVKPITNQVSGDPFSGMRNVLNEEIEMAMLLQTLATGEGRHMARAASETHMSVLDLLVFFIKGLVIDMLTNDLVKPLMQINFANFDMSLLPKISMGDYDRRDWAEDVIAIAKLYESGFMGESQKIGYDKFIAAPERDVESDKQAIVQKMNDEADAKARATTNNQQRSAVPTGNKNPSGPSAIKEMKDIVTAYEALHGEI